jgi:CRP/FNR family transcriptional regulator, cyclic AMP receptor protein
MQTLLDKISPELTAELYAAGHKRSFGVNQEIFAHGEEALLLPVVISGRIKMVHFLEPGKEVIVGIFEAGEMFAIPPVFDGGRYPATAIAMEDSQLLLIERQKFLDLLRRSSELSFSVISWMCSMLRDKTATIQNLATASPDQRVAAVLLKLAEKEPSNMPIKIGLRRQDIAHMAGLTTETTIRVTGRLAERSLVRIEHGKIMIDDMEKLRRHVAG